MKNVKLVIAKAQKQDQKAFNELFNYHWSYLYNFQLKKTGNKDFADDPVHSTILGLLLWPLLSNEQNTMQHSVLPWLDNIKRIFKEIF